MTAIADTRPGPVKVAFDARVLERPQFAERGIGRYARSLLDALRADGRDVVVRRGRRRPSADVLHSPSIDFAALLPRMPYVVTVHDLVPLKYPERYLRTGTLHRIRYAATKRATRLIVPTEAVAFDCERFLEVDRARITVIPEGTTFTRVDDPAPLLHRFNLPSAFVLWVGGLNPPDPRKRIRELAAAGSRRDGLPLVLAGAVGPEAEALARTGKVLLIGRPSDEEL